jgi:hypothetical protein
MSSGKKRPINSSGGGNPNNPNPAKKARGSKYTRGQHGAKKEEQQVLANKFGSPVSGDTHESEHPVGMEAILHGSGENRKKGRGNLLEKCAPAYQEQTSLHRDHIGTGTTTTKTGMDKRKKKGLGDSGFNSETYRSTQRDLIKEGDVSSAVQINQLDYAFNPKFQSAHKSPTTANKQADDSHKAMVDNMDSFKYAAGTQNKGVKVDKTSKLEMDLSRQIAQSGQWDADQLSKSKNQLWDAGPW